MCALTGSILGKSDLRYAANIKTKRSHICPKFTDMWLHKFIL
jgi:hypothetical protein